ncbi:MAG TPA: inorganic pyrophosphatase [Saprospiraceae bacterium]|nr:inorganic pyrophosphatase [Saprospiraceae bacterium]HMQ85408.1 inorganic pyrophosphatase [Saprospiraceae bacterium]
MEENELQKLWAMLGLRYQSHPWHGIPIGERAPDVVTAFIEITPSDTVKYEIDKRTGFLKVDRPQKFSNIVPTLYGFIPQTYCQDAAAAYCMQKTGRKDMIGDGDPLDICVLTERLIPTGGIIVQVVPIGGFRLIDNREADDKIIAVLQQDEIYGQLRDITELPDAIINRLKHYFLTYKQLPNQAPQCEITHVYGRTEAQEVIRCCQEDYENSFGGLESKMSEMVLNLLRIQKTEEDS